MGLGLDKNGPALKSTAWSRVLSQVVQSPVLTISLVNSICFFCFFLIPTESPCMGHHYATIHLGEALATNDIWVLTTYVENTKNHQ